MGHIEWNQDFHTEIVASAYSEYPIRFEEESLRFINQRSYEYLIDECIVLKKAEPNQINTYGNFGSIFKIKGQIGWYVYYLYMNGSEDIVINEKCILRNKKGI